MKTFSDNLKYAMAQAGMSQRELSEKSGCSRAAVSQYLTGKNQPGEDKIRAMADALGVAPEVLAGFEAAPGWDAPLPVIKIGVRSAARCMCKSEKFVEDSLQNEKVPFGYALPRKSGKWSYYINPIQFRDYVGAARFNEFFGQRARGEGAALNSVELVKSICRQR